MNNERDNIVAFMRRATVDDYAWNPEVGGYVLQLTDRFRPGSIASDPAEGAAFYNHYIDTMAATAANRSKSIKLMLDLVLSLLDGSCEEPYGSLARAALLSYYDADRFPLPESFTRELDQLTREQTEVMYAAFWNRAELKVMLTPGRIARLALQRQR